ncbi:MAG: hypothetical protein GY765_26395 [bacterium]|nr:hypothetical protein [bacterium]
MDPQQLLAEITELVNIPPVGVILYHKAQELKELNRDELELYRKLKKSFRRDAYGRMQVLQDKTSGSPPTYCFQLDKSVDNMWQVTEIEPYPPPNRPIGNILPSPIVKYMTAFRPNPAQIEENASFALNNLKGRLFNLRFVRYSDTQVLGSISDISELQDMPAPRDPENNLVDINEYYTGKSTEHDYNDLMAYMEHYPEFKEHIFSEFFLKWKPLLDRKLL